MRAAVPTEGKAVVNLARRAGRNVRVALEEGTQPQWLHELIVGCPRSQEPTPI